MLLTLGDMDFLSKTTVNKNDGMLVAKGELTEGEKGRLLDIDELNVLTYGYHLIENYRDLQ